MSATATLVLKAGLSGGESLRIYDVSPGAGDTTGSVTIDDVAEVYVLGIVNLIEAPAAGAQNVVQAKENSSTKNQVDYALWNSGNAAATSLKDFRLLLKTVS